MTTHFRFTVSSGFLAGIVVAGLALPASVNAQSRTSASGARRQTDRAAIQLQTLVNQANALMRQGAATRAAAPRTLATAGNSGAFLGGTGTTAHITYSGTPGLGGNAASHVGGRAAAPTIPYTVHSAIADRVRANPVLGPQMLAVDRRLNAQDDAAIKVGAFGYRWVPVR